MKDLRIEISVDAQAYAQSQLGKGDYADASEYIESLTREDRLARAQLDGLLANQRAALEQAASEGHHSGDAITVDAAYWEQKRQRLSDEFGRQQK